MILAIMMLFAATSEAQQIVEKLADGSYVVLIDNKEFRALDANKMREIEKTKIDLDAAQKTNAQKDTQIAAQSQEISLLKKDVQIVGLQRDSFKADFERSQEDSKRNFNLFMTERELRTEAQQFIPHGKVNGFGGKVLSFLDSGYVQAFWKMAVPTYQMVRCR